jgi:hypothetical protein
VLFRSRNASRNIHHQVETSRIWKEQECREMNYKLVNERLVQWQLESCEGGKLLFSYTKINYKRTMEFEIRAYTTEKEKLADGEEPSSLEAGPYVADIRQPDSQPFGFRVSHTSIQLTKKLSQLTVYFTHDHIQTREPLNYVTFELSAGSDELSCQIHFSQLNPKVDLNNLPFKSREITANFRYVDVDNHGVFYADVNAYKIVKREVGKVL